MFSPKIVKTGMFSKNYVSYIVKTKPFGYEVQRRYSDFLWLRKILLRDYPGYFIPPMAEKNLGKNFDNEFIQERMEILQKFLNALAEHGELKASIYFLTFLKCEQTDQFEKVKKELNKFKYPISVNKIPL